MAEAGQVSLKRKRPLGAEAAFERAISLQPSLAEACRLLGRLRWQQGLPEAAQPLYEQAAAAGAPDDILAAELGDFFAFRKAMPLAAEYYRSSLSQGGGSRPGLILAFGRALKELQAWEEAEQVLSYGVSAFPGEVSLPLLMGETLLVQQRWQEALTWFQQVLAISPKDADGYYGLARVALGLGGREEAAKQLRTTLRLNPYHAEATRLLQDLHAQATIEAGGPS